MIYSYYFDIEKTKLINFGFDIHSIENEDDDTVKTTFTAFVEEVIDGSVNRREEYSGTFTFLNQVQGSRSHNINFLRHRFEEENKWVFEVVNNTNESETVVIGLITDAITSNPLGFDIFYSSEEYNADMKANNLSKIDEAIKGPLLSQTLINEKFDKTGMPEGFISNSYLYDSELKQAVVEEFEQTLPHSVPEDSAFNFSLDIAPEAVVSNKMLFKVEIENIGVFKAYSDRCTFLNHNQDESLIKEIMYSSEKSAEDFYRNGQFRLDAALFIEGTGLIPEEEPEQPDEDQEGGVEEVNSGPDSFLRIRYANTSTQIPYYSGVKINKIKMISGTKSEPDEETSPKSFKQRIDNLYVSYKN